MNPGMVLYDMTLIDHIVAMLVCVVAPVLTLTSRQMAMEDIRLEPEEKIRLYHSNALLLFVFTLVVVTVWRLPGRSVIALGFDWPVLSPVVLLLTLAVVLFYALDYFFQYGIPKWRARTMQQRHASLTFVPTNTKELLHFVFLALAAGIGE